MGHFRHGLPFALKALRPGYVRFASQLKRTDQASRQPNAPLPFPGLDLSRAVRLGVKSAFPSVTNATDAQATFIPAIIQGKDVMIKGDTGSGKRSHPTSLLLVPHRDLAYQFSHWIERMVMATGDPRFPTPTQVIVRGQEDPSSQASRLRENSPSILIGTPQAILDVLQKEERAIDFSCLRTVVVDEVDYIIDFIPADASKERKKKLAAKMRRHPSAGKLLLDQIYAQRNQSDGSAAARGYPQLVICSATLQTGLRQQLYQNGWYGKGVNSIVKVRSEMRTGETRTSESIEDFQGGELVQHCGLVFSEDGTVRDVEGAVEPKWSSSEDAHGQKVQTSTNFQGGDLPDTAAQLKEEYAVTPSPFHPVRMEGIASIFATDVPKVALLVLPASAPVQRAVYDLRMLGINAFGLDLLCTDRGQAHLIGGSGGAIEEEPTLFVSTTASTRGIDLPDLSHVFVWGVVDANSYLHASGRVGRFGREGRVVSALEGKSEDRDEPGRYLRMLSKSSIAPPASGGQATPSLIIQPANSNGDAFDAAPKHSSVSAVSEPTSHPLTSVVMRTANRGRYD
ncbi:P-loop containing nucleoside triphosphate hydrolase protein [Russula earlei]|uniref:P-loop containing nucleoside triphosphate hydrolase protein n=1 Tax=Russula earlei TaxID=71964 RepID=A0ACC0UMP1_9AGAM|nr:P-loop containing nucleoside triphosphate hydrolase protein [Russula earlei]